MMRYIIAFLVPALALLGCLAEAQNDCEEVYNNGYCERIYVVGNEESEQQTIYYTPQVDAIVIEQPDSDETGIVHIFEDGELVPHIQHEGMIMEWE